MAEVRVRLPLDALGKFEERSLKFEGEQHEPISHFTLPTSNFIGAIGRAAKVLDFQFSEVGSIPTWHSRVWANGKPAASEAVECRFEPCRPDY